MATLGDPLTDLGLLLVYWGNESSATLGSITDMPAAVTGFPSGAELTQRYARSTGLDLAPLPWYVAFGCFKLAVILEGIHFRYTQGQTVGGGLRPDRRRRPRSGLGRPARSEGGGMSELLSHDVAGDGEAVLLLHSGAADRRQWDGQWAALTASHRVVRPDLRGFGATPPPAEPGWSDSADLLALLDALGIDRVAVVGSSYGGRIALELATVAPHRVSQLLLLCTAYPGVPRTPAVEAFGAQEDALLEAGDVEAAVALNVATWLGPDADDEARAALTTMQRHTFEVQLPAPDDLDPVRPDVDAAAIDVPAVVFSGGHDLDHFQDVARHLADQLPHARLVELSWAGHLPGLERPEQTGYLLLAELAGSTDRGD